MFENKQKAIFAKMKDGKIVVYMGKNEDGTPKTASYDTMSGIIKGITLKEGTYNGEIVKNWNIRVEDNGEVVFLTIGYSSGFTRGLLNSLCNADLSKPITLSCYVKNDYNCASLSQNAEIIRWKYDNCPKTKKIMVGSKEVVDDSDAIQWMLGLIQEITQKINSNFKANSDKAEMEKSTALVKGIFDVKDDGEALNDLPF